MNDKNPLGVTTVPSVPSDGLVPVGTRPGLSYYIASLWNRRHFIIAESRAKLSSSTRKNVLGYAWLFLNPIMSALAYYLIFGVILGTSRGVENFVGYLIVGVFFFQFTLQCLTAGTSSVKSGAAMIRAFQFPRASLPIATVVRNALDFGPTLVIMIILLAVIPPAEALTWRVVLIIPVVLLQTMFNGGLACLFARLGHAFPDISQVISILGRFWLYGSGVFFSIETLLQSHPELLSVMRFNPMHSYLEIVRNSILYGVDSPMWMWATATAWAFGLLVFGFVIFWAGEEKYGRV